MENNCFESFMSEMRPLLEKLLQCEENQAAPHTSSGQLKTHMLEQAYQNDLEQQEETSPTELLLNKAGTNKRDNFPWFREHAKAREILAVSSRVGLAGKDQQRFIMFMTDWMGEVNPYPTKESIERWAEKFKNKTERDTEGRELDKDVSRILNRVDKVFRGWSGGGQCRT